MAALEGIKRGARQNQNILIICIKFLKNKQYLYREEHGVCFPEVAVQEYASVSGLHLLAQR